MGVFIEPFDFRTVLINHFLGSLELFMFAFVIVTSFAAAKFKMPNKMFLIVLSLGAVIFSSILGQAVYILTILIIGLVTFKAVAKTVT